MKAILSKLPNPKAAPGWMFRTKNGILSSVVVVSTLMVGAVVMSAPEPDKKEIAETAYAVTTVQLEPTAVSPELTLYGKVESPRQSSLTSAVTAHVASVPVREGELVEAGTLLIQLDPTDAHLVVMRRQADLQEAKANLRTLRLQVEDNRNVLSREQSLFDLSVAKVERHRQLRNQKTISQETLNAVLAESDRQAISLNRQQGLVNDASNQLARAEAQVDRAESNLAEAGVVLERTSVRAPFAGRVTAISVSPGELVQPGARIAEMYDTTNMEVRAQIPASSLDEITQSLDRGISLPARIQLRNREITASLTRLTGEVTRGHSSIEGLFVVSDSAGLELGRSVGVVVRLPAVAGSVMVPVNALYGHDKIFVVVNERLKGVTVERLGEVRDEKGRLNVIIRSTEIDATVPIVTSQISNAVTGLKVSLEKGTGLTPPFLDDDEMATALR